MDQKSLLEEKKIIELCKKGDRRAYMAIYDKYSGAMYNVAYRFMNNYDLAQDMMQDGFIKAFSKLDVYSGDVIFGAWLKRIIVNTCLDEIRKKKDIISFDDTRFIEPIIELDDSYSSNKEVLEEVMNSINNLPEKYRIVISLFLVEGYDYEEISSILGIKNATARSIVARAKMKLKENLEVYSYKFNRN
ncbi:MAG: RNA polymerase sigma factor [Flavobacteriales bacterium]|nr:RNA polymerase sigma factor [Flavobacteriales bacterium]